MYRQLRFLVFIEMLWLTNLFGPMEKDVENQQYLCPFIFFINCFYKFTLRNVLVTDADEQRHLLDSCPAAPAGRASVSLHLLRIACHSLIANKPAGSCLKTGQQSIFVIIRKIKKLIHVCWIPQIDDFIFIMEQYFHY